MKSLFGGIFGALIVFFVGATTFPKTERVYNCSKWEPTDHITIPVNMVKNDLNKFEQQISIEKNRIETELKQFEKIVDTLE
jgi:hypothetical protein